MSEDDETTRSATLVSPLENDDLVANSLRLLPALPSSLLHVSLVCKRWYRLVSSHHFLRQFRAHHRNPPLVGFFSMEWKRIIFTPMLDPPDRIPASRFSLQVLPCSTLLSCPHGRVLIYNQLHKQRLLVWEPVTGELCRVSMPPSFHPTMIVVHAAVVCASTEQGHIHGSCHSDPFQVVMVASDREQFYAFAYSSQAGAWGNNSLSVKLLPYMKEDDCGISRRSTLGNSICFFLAGEKAAAIVEFDWARQTLAFLDPPSEVSQQLNLLDFHDERCQCLVKSSDSGGLILIVVKLFTVHIWERTFNADGVAKWMLWKNTTDLNNLFSLRMVPEDLTAVPLSILGLDEGGNVLVKQKESRAIFLVDLESSKFKKLSGTCPVINDGHPFSTFYTPGKYHTCILQLEQKRIYLISRLLVYRMAFISEKMINKNFEFELFRSFRCRTDY
ncbi:hypothetical protein HU200_047951 [Digitaria exilis]|uniref:F-box domain-containing protein n=1 Tax=Digitaria exilis TaxID=1010633 RepID=A0A835AYC1_9POAL|nr:hypothetical protein HU200_047951 [Digitaria exilis]